MTAVPHNTSFMYDGSQIRGIMESNMYVMESNMYVMESNPLCSAALLSSVS